MYDTYVIMVMFHWSYVHVWCYFVFRANAEKEHDGSEDDSEEENEEGDYTVYECPGLAPVRFYK